MNTFLSHNERKTKKWMTPEMLDLMEERRKAKADIQKYRELEKQVKKRCYKVNSKTVYQKIKEVIGKKATPKTGCIRSKDGDTLMEKVDILNRWSEYITELYHDDRGPPPSTNNEESHQILEEELKKSLKVEKKARSQDPPKYHPKC